MSKKPEPACIGCEYLFFAGLKRGCFHPDDPHYLVSGPAKCDRKKDDVDRLSITEFRERMQCSQ